MAFEKVISTKNLYMAELQICLQTCISDVDNLFYTLDYVLIKPLNRNFYLDISNNKEFIDILTNTKYISHEIGFSKGEVYVKNLVPCITNRKYITETEAKLILQHKNQIFLDLASINKNNILNIFGTSTKNLYMAELQKCNETCIGYSSHFQKNASVLVKPLEYNLYSDNSNIKEFVDILTNTKYISQEIGCSKGKVYVKSLVPFTNGRNYIMSKEVAKILQDQNPLFLDLASTMQKRKIKNF